MPFSSVRRELLESNSAPMAMSALLTVNPLFSQVSGCLIRGPAVLKALRFSSAFRRPGTGRLAWLLKKLHSRHLSVIDQGEMAAVLLQCGGGNRVRSLRRDRGIEPAFHRAPIPNF